MDKLYKNKAIQTNQAEAEKLAKCLIEKKNIDDLYSIKKITRMSSYDAKHTGKTDSKATALTERLLAIKLFNKNFIHIGKVFDYEIPLKNSNTDKGVGKIDLVAKNKNIVTLLELKAKDSKETLLRCVLEIFTYWKQLDHQKFIHDFDLPHDIIINKAVFVFEGSKAYDEYYKDDTYTRQLMDKLEVGIYFIKELSNEEYEVIKP